MFSWLRYIFFLVLNLLLNGYIYLRVRDVNDQVRELSKILHKYLRKLNNLIKQVFCVMPLYRNEK